LARVSFVGSTRTKAQNSASQMAPFYTAIWTLFNMRLTVGGVLFITLLTSILSVMQIGDAWRNMIFGFVILAMLLFQTLRKGAQ
jgi:hypothetical protein